MGRWKKKESETEEVTTQIYKLGDFLTGSVELDPRMYLYMSMNEIWALGTRCCMLDTSDIDGNPEFSEQNNFEFVIEAAAIIDIVENLNLQIPRPAPEQLLDAFLFYYDNDAFISVAEHGRPT